MALTIADLTSGVSTSPTFVVTGNGVFDDLMETVNAHVKAQYDAERITQSDYSTVYLGALQTTLTQAVQFLLGRGSADQDALLKEAQTALVTKQGITEDEKALLVKRQTKGFDDDAKQKLLKQTLDSWSVAYSVAKDANSIPDTIKVDSIDSVMHNALAGLGIEIGTNPLGIEDVVE